MYDSLSSLKDPSMDQHHNNPSYLQAVEIHHHIMRLASVGGKIPPISLKLGEENKSSVA